MKEGTYEEEWLQEALSASFDDEARHKKELDEKSYVDADKLYFANFIILGPN